MADHEFPCLMFYLENQACADKFLRFLHENGIIPELIAEHQTGHSYGISRSLGSCVLESIVQIVSGYCIGVSCLMFCNEFRDNSVLV